MWKLTLSEEGEKILDDLEDGRDTEAVTAVVEAMIVYWYELWKRRRCRSSYGSKKRIGKFERVVESEEVDKSHLNVNISPLAIVAKVFDKMPETHNHFFTTHVSSGLY